MDNLELETVAVEIYKATPTETKIEYISKKITILCLLSEKFVLSKENSYEMIIEEGKFKYIFDFGSSLKKYGIRFETSQFVIEKKDYLNLKPSSVNITGYIVETIFGNYLEMDNLEFVYQEKVG